MPRGIKAKPDCKKVAKLIRLFADQQGHDVPTGSDILKMWEFTFQHGRLDDATLEYLRWCAGLLTLYAQERCVCSTPAQHRRFMRKAAANQKEMGAHRRKVDRAKLLKAA